MVSLRRLARRKLFRQKETLMRTSTSEYLKSPRLRLFLGVFVLFAITLVCGDVFGKGSLGPAISLASKVIAVALLGSLLFLFAGRRR
ncbi:MAG TPA: hypothetical protein VGI95_09960 [Caulobacteraceae bacterium]